LAQTTSWIILGGAAAIALVTLNPRLLKRDSWRATVTPLASIIGSGFLVAGPILGHAAGRLAVAAMLGLCAIAWLFGAAIRHNIRTVEPALDSADPPRWLTLSDRLSDLLLAAAYFVSVAYYLNLFAAFALRGFGITDPLPIRGLSSAVIVGLGLIGLLRGLRWLENIELPAVGLKLALIGGVVMALVYADAGRIAAGGAVLPTAEHPRGMAELRILLGLVILVQGFETSRYLGDAYDGELRVRTMRRAQILATLIYAAFIALITPFFAARLPGQGGETAIITMLAPLGWALAPAIIATALASQLSAAVADMNGAGGLVRSASKDRLGTGWGYALTAGAALAITWIADIYQIIVYASKAFVLYYGVQAAVAARTAWQGQVANEPQHEDQNGDRPQRPRRWHAAGYALGVVIALLVIVFGMPAESGNG